MDDFSTTFAALTGHQPMPWQEKLYQQFQSDRDDYIPRTCSLPTGLGKTSVIAIWLLALANGFKVPRRLVYIVNRRTGNSTSMEPRLFNRGKSGYLRRLQKNVTSSMGPDG